MVDDHANASPNEHADSTKKQSLNDAPVRLASAIAPAVLRGYQETDYRVLGSECFVLRIGDASAALLAAHQRHQVACSAFLTACNPFSQPTAAEVNAARQSDLVAQLERLGLVYMEGVGQHPSNGWPGERSVLVLGLEIQPAKVLAAHFQQNAFVWSGADAVPQLILLR